MLAKIGPHRLQDLRQYGRGRVIVEINSTHHTLCLLYSRASQLFSNSAAEHLCLKCRTRPSRALFGCAPFWASSEEDAQKTTNRPGTCSNPNKKHSRRPYVLPQFL